MLEDLLADTKTHKTYMSGQTVVKAYKSTSPYQYMQMEMMLNQLLAKLNTLNESPRLNLINKYFCKDGLFCVQRPAGSVCLAEQMEVLGAKREFKIQ